MTLRVTVFEDEAFYADALAQHLRAWSVESGKQVVLTQFTDGTQLTTAAESDLLFFDIDLPMVDGLTAARRVRAQGLQVPIVFVTGHHEFVYDGYRVEAFRFLHKPISREAVDECMARAQKYHNSCRMEYLTLRLKNGVVRILTDDILYIEVQQHYCSIMTRHGKQKILISLRDLLAQLPSDDLIQCHRSFVVNCCHVHSIRRGEIYLDTLDVVPLSRSYAAFILKKVSRLMKG